MQLLWPFCLVGVQTSLEHLVLAHPVGLTASLKVAGNSLARLDRLDRRRRRWWSWSGRGRCCCLHLGRIARIVLVPGFGRRRARRRAWRRRACRRWRHWRRRKVHSRHGRPHVHVRRAREWPGGTRRKLRPAPVWNWRRLGRHQMLGRRRRRREAWLLGRHLLRRRCFLLLLHWVVANATTAGFPALLVVSITVSKPMLPVPPLRPPLLLVVIIFGVADRSLGTVTVRHAVQWQLCVTVSSQGNLSQPHDT